MIWVARIERRRRIEGCESRRRGLADDGRSRLPQHRDDRRIRAWLPALVDRRAHFSRKVCCIDDVLDGHGYAAQGPGACRADGFGTADEGADGFVMSADRFKRLGDRSSGRKLAGIDAALKFGERDHGCHSLKSAAPLLRSMWGSSKGMTAIRAIRFLVMRGLVRAFPFFLLWKTAPTRCALTAET